MKRLLTLFGASVLVLAMVACGGDSKDGGLLGGANQPSRGNSNSAAAGGDVSKFFNQYVLTYFNVAFGFTKPQQLIDMFDESCKSKVSAKDMEASLALLKSMLPKVDKLDDIDLGKLNVEKLSDGYKVTPADPNAVRIKVKGQFVKASDYFGKLGFSDAADSISQEALTLKETNGRLAVSDCTDLTDLTSP